MAAPLSNLNAASNPPNLHNPTKRSPAGVTAYASPNIKSPPPISRRVSLGLATAAALFQQLGIWQSTAAEQVDTPGDNGLWLTGPIPSPTVTNKIENEETGTRSFLRKGIFMADIGPEMTAYRLKHYAFDLLALADLIEQMDAWNYVRMYLCLRSTVMYYDFDKVISAAADDEKPRLTDLANRLFDSVEKLEAAVKQKSESLTRSCYADTEAILKEVMSRMA